MITKCISFKFFLNRETSPEQTSYHAAFWAGGPRPRVSESSGQNAD